MARLPSALQKSEDDLSNAIRVRKENLARLNRGQAPEPLPEPVALRPQPLVDPVRPPLEQPQLQAEPEPTDTPVAPVEPVAPAVDPEEMRKLQSRAETSEGMLRKSNEERQRDREAAKKALETEQARAEALQAQLDERERKERASKPLSMEELLKHYTAEEIDEYGEQHCRKQLMVSVAAGEAAAKRLIEAEARARKAADDEQRAQQARISESAFWQSINTAVPNWQDINAGTEFRDWLTKVPLGSDYSRQTAIDKAKERYDAQKIIDIFNAWTQSLPKPPPAAAPSRRVIPNGRPNANLPTEPATPQSVSREQIREHNSRMARDRKYRNSTEATAEAARIDQAARAGAIRQ